MYISPLWYIFVFYSSYSIGILVYDSKIVYVIAVVEYIRSVLSLDKT